MTPNRSLAPGLCLLALTLLLGTSVASPLLAHARTSAPEAATETTSAEGVAVTSVEAPSTEGVAATSVQEAGEEALVQEEEAHEEADAHHSPRPPGFLVIPFAVLLLMIATGPLFYPHHWHHHYPKYAVGLGVLVMAYYLLVLHASTPLVHAAEEYFAFIALLASLYIASGGILIKTDFAGTPKANSALLFVGAVISNVIGTTGASMLLIRPFMRLNRGRLKAYHIVFFIFTVSNVGGALTPIGDPPLFLGFLRGVPFFWTFTHVWYIWLPTLIILIGIFYVIDSRNKEESIREDAEDFGVEETLEGTSPDQPTLSPATPRGAAIKITGKKNFAWLAVVIASVFIDPNVLGWVPELHVGDFHFPFGIREIIMFSVCFLAYKLADQAALRGNEFNFEPIREVAWLFVGIFATMQPALELIRLFAQANADALGVTTFYYGTGILSGILDNAPTYVSFLSAAMGKFGLDVNQTTDVVAFAAVGLSDPQSWFYLQAISVAAVFFGALTYIGNGPNFMVKAIAESSGVECPSFVGYMVRYSIPILIPVYVVVWVVFFSGWVF